MKRTRAERRCYMEKAKVKARKIIRRWHCEENNPEFKPDPKWVGHVATTHGKPCSCYMCGNPRKYWNELTISERKDLEESKSQLKEWRLSS